MPKKKNFFKDNDEISYASGILWIKNNKIDGLNKLDQLKNDKKILIQHIKLNKKECFSDFGGSVEKKDENILETACREFCEETNFAMKRGNDYLTIDDIKKIITDPEYLIEKIYFKNSKYTLFIVNFPENCKINFKKSGKFEETDNIERKVSWISLKKFYKVFNESKIHPRLWSFSFSNIIGNMLNEGDKKNIEKKIKRFGFSSEI